MGIINVDLTATNIDALIGKTAIADTKITRKSGVIEVFGEQWVCTPIDDKDIREGTKVKVVKIDGNKLIVERVNK